MKSMVKWLMPIILGMMILSSVLPVSGAEDEETLRLNREYIENNLQNNRAAFKMMHTERNVKKLEITDEALKYIEEKGIQITLETNHMTLDFTPAIFKTKEWQTALKSGEPLSVQLIIKRGSGIKVTENFDQWYYQQLGIDRLGTSSWELSGEILVAGVKQYEIHEFASNLAIRLKYPSEALISVADENKLTMFLFNETQSKWDDLGGSIDRVNKTIRFQTKTSGLFMIVVNQKPQQFTDIRGHWAESDILAMTEKKVVILSGDRKFYPNREITRAEFASFVVRTLGLIHETGTQRFQDVGVDYPYYQDIMTAAYHGIVTGVGSGRFAPNARITRQEIAAMMVRAEKLKGKSLPADQSVLNRYQDQREIALWARESCAQVVQSGIMVGKSDRLFAPKSTVTRAEAIVLLHRLAKNLD
ncbi:S-layer homology domain-containing protein [Dehalobacterium formicoaceticum]|uniref:S-layer homology domain-containing protein n=1 Tax=Dehalobacterium formicoaceticum TaxID=51515 RepID=A0ABT1Y3E7_9FIRM|nr:S-layer homology domain-containing protein [Dehalobacterium formicoaceticum]MCR6545403.1 S-layer homology domain-containing protein [Dehalobacterium formicoaceticum]